MSLDALLADIRACRACGPELAHEPRPVVRVSADTRLLICGQAPGRRVLPQVKAAAIGLARAGRVEILRHNKPVDPNAPIKGVYRLRAHQPEPGGDGNS